MTSVSLVLRTKNISHHLKATLNRHRNATQTYWKCVNGSYPGRVTLDIQDRVQSVKQKHFHEPNQVKTEADEVIECMKKRTKEETIPTPKIHQEALCVIATDKSEEVATVEVLYVTMKMRYLLVVCIYERERKMLKLMSYADDEAVDAAR